MASVNAEAVLLRRHHTVSFVGCDKLTDAAAQLLAQCPKLKTVHFKACKKFTDAAAQHLAQCPQLQIESCMELKLQIHWSITALI